MPFSKLLGFLTDATKCRLTEPRKAGAVRLPVSDTCGNGHCGCRTDAGRDEIPSLSREESIRLLAYERWERATDGTPVDDEESRRFWEEAERIYDNRTAVTKV